MRGKACGFTLLEMLAALAVFAVCCSVLLVTFGRSAQVLDQVHHSDRLSLAARSVLDEQLNTPLDVGQREGSIDQSIHWRMRVSQSPNPRGQLPLYRIDLRIEERGRQFDVSTLVVQNQRFTEARP